MAELHIGSCPVSRRLIQGMGTIRLISNLLEEAIHKPYLGTIKEIID